MVFSLYRAEQRNDGSARRPSVYDRPENERLPFTRVLPAVQLRGSRCLFRDVMVICVQELADMTW